MEPALPGTHHEGDLPRTGALGRQMRWIVNLRWVAGLTVIAGGLAEQFWLRWYGNGWGIAVVGVVIVLGNVVFRALGKKNGKGERQAAGGALYWIVWGQILADLACLTVLVVLTGGDESPLRGFFVLHMVFASLLLPRVMAFGMALGAIGMVEGVLAASPWLGVSAAARTAHSAAVGVGWDVTMLATVYLSSRVAGDLRRQRRRLARRNLRIRRMAAQLRRQQEALAQREKMFALGRMAAGVAHEVTNPLASMDGLLQLLERRPERATPEQLANLRGQVVRINQIVRQLMAFAQPEAQGKAADTGEWRQESLNVIVTRVLDVLRFDGRLAKMEVRKQLDERLKPMRVQPAALEQVLINLVMNAADAMEGMAKPLLEVKTEAGDGWGELVVADNGHGMTEAVRERIFEPFFTTKGVGKGTGLGLSISYSLVKKLGGEISVTSEVDKGTVFRVRLPVEK
jgi:signal transduction histidine kinase